MTDIERFDVMVESCDMIIKVGTFPIMESELYHDIMAQFKLAFIDESGYPRSHLLELSKYKVTYDYTMFKNRGINLFHIVFN